MNAEKNTKQLDLFTGLLEEKGYRKTTERYAIFDLICSIQGHFDIEMLHQQMEDRNFHVSKATLYNTIELLVNAGWVIRHQFGSQFVQYELMKAAETHYHLICTNCGVVLEQKNDSLISVVKSSKITRFTPAFYSLYVYGICSKCKYKMQRRAKK